MSTSLSMRGCRGRSCGKSGKSGIAPGGGADERMLAGRVEIILGATLRWYVALAPRQCVGCARVAPDTGAAMELTELDSVGQASILQVCGDIDLETAEVFRATLTELIERGSGPVVVDISGVAFLDSTGLRVLDDVRRTADRHGTQLALVCPHERLLRLFRITGLLDRFAIEPTAERALASTTARADHG